MSNAIDVQAMEDPEGRLEQAFIDEYLRGRGFETSTLAALSADRVKELMSAAAAYAAAKLAAIEARAHFVHELHG